MDFQHREGGKTGSGGVLSASETNVDRRERLRKLALETIDLTKDPYFMKNHLGSYECRLCLTQHTNEGSYLAHTQGKKHQANIGRRAAREAAKEGATVGLGLAGPRPPPPAAAVQPMKRQVAKIGRPGFKITKLRDPITRYLGFLFQLHYPHPLTTTSIVPRHRLMSAFEQRHETPNRAYQYLLVAAEPYETVAFKIPSKEIERIPEGSGSGNAQNSKTWEWWDPDTRVYTLQIMFRSDI